MEKTEIPAICDRDSLIGQLRMPPISPEKHTAFSLSPFPNIVQ